MLLFQMNGRGPDGWNIAHCLPRQSAGSEVQQPDTNQCQYGMLATQHLDPQHHKTGSTKLNLQRTQVAFVQGGTEAQVATSPVLEQGRKSPAWLLPAREGAWPPQLSPQDTQTFQGKMQQGGVKARAQETH